MSAAELPLRRLKPLAGDNGRCRNPTSRSSAEWGSENVDPNISRPHTSYRKKDPAGRTRNTSPFPEIPLSPSSSSSSVKVVVRIRPANAQNAVKEPSSAVNDISPTSLNLGNRGFSFDSVLGPASSQEDVFNAVGVSLVRDALSGFNTSLVSYGQTGCGKTYTMWGPSTSMVDIHSIHTNHGIAPRLFHMLFSDIRKMQEQTQGNYQYQCRCSFLEIYNEQINDLINPNQRNLQMRDDAKNGLYVENLTEEYVTTGEDATHLLIKGLLNRKVGATSVNTKSSRSHIVFNCMIESWCKETLQPKQLVNSKTSRICLVDLAGFDKDFREEFGRLTLSERHVEQSLSKLGKLIDQLSRGGNSGDTKNILYSDSCLTHLLRETLGGNVKVTFLCSISPDDRYKAGSLSTLRFGERAKHLGNQAVINEIKEDDVNGLTDQIRQLKEELIKAKSNKAVDSFGSNYYQGGRFARASLNKLRASLTRSLILPNIGIGGDDTEEEEAEQIEADDDDDDVMTMKRLCAQLEDEVTSSVENVGDDTMEEVEGGTEDDIINRIVPVEDVDDDLILSTALIGKENETTEETMDSAAGSEEQSASHWWGGKRSSLYSTPTGVSPADSLAASLRRGIEIIDSHERRSASGRKPPSQVCLSLEHFSSLSSRAAAAIGDHHRKADAGVQTDMAEATERRRMQEELEALCKDQADVIEQLNCILQSQSEKNEAERSPDQEILTPLEEDERQDYSLGVRKAKISLIEIRMKLATTGATTDDATMEEGMMRHHELMEMESRWICLTEELRQELESVRRHAEKKDRELSMEKECSDELGDALKRAILGHARMVEHYVELQENHNALLSSHRRATEWMAAVRALSEKMAASDGRRRRGCVSPAAFVDGLAAELSKQRMEKERSFLKEQNKSLKTQLRDTAEAVHAAGELLVRLKESEQAVSASEEKLEKARQENERLARNVEEMKQRHAMEMETMKHYMAQSRLPDSALQKPFSGGEQHQLGEEQAAAGEAEDDDSSWRSAFHY